MKHCLLLIGFCLCLTNSYSQNPVNAYAKVTDITGSTVTIANINEAYHTFNAGEDVIIMQMQRNVVYDNSNTANYGGVSNMLTAGRYEMLKIASRTGSAIVLTAAPTIIFDFTSVNSSLQIISFRRLGSPNYATTSNITALPWDGNIGGVVALRVAGTLTLNHTITANGAGFRGGIASSGTNGGACDPNTYFTGGNTVSAEKGEGVFRRTAAAEQYGRGKLVNGGGGGNVHNAGGGGGGNVTTGGEGGFGYSCTATTKSGGLGGLALDAYISSSRVFMGGGGGGGHQNNNVGSSGGNGGGIILINANKIITTGSCTNRTISANGNNAIDAGGNDGAGGGGAAGSIIFDVTSFGVLAGCPMVADASGGKGGSVGNAAAHGGGGGGGQGRIIFSAATPANVSSVTNNGGAGCNNNSAPCTNSAGLPSGSNGSGITVNDGNTPLPVSLLYFSGVYNSASRGNDLNWATASEENNDYFTLERSTDGVTYEKVIQVEGHHSTDAASKYHYEDTDANAPFHYYRLSQTDLDGTYKLLKVIRVDRDDVLEESVWIYPNPVNQSEDITIDIANFPLGTYTLVVLDVQGVVRSQEYVTISKNFQSIEVSTSKLKRGVYTLRMGSSSKVLTRKIAVR